MNSDFELLNFLPIGRSGLCWSLTVVGHVIFLAALISVVRLFTIAYTRGTNVSTEYIDDLSVYFD